MYPGAHLEQHADKPAVIMAGSGWTQTFSELDEAANRLARLLRDTGLQPGDHVAICMENHPRYLEVLWGCNYAGLIYTAASSRLTSEELGYVVDDCGARVLITSQRMAGAAAEIVAHTPKIERRLMLDGVIADHESYEEAVADCDPRDRVAAIKQGAGAKLRVLGNISKGGQQVLNFPLIGLEHLLIVGRFVRRVNCKLA